MPVITDSISVFNHILPNIAVRGNLKWGRTRRQASSGRFRPHFKVPRTTTKRYRTALNTAEIADLTLTSFQPLERGAGV